MLSCWLTSVEHVPCHDHAEADRRVAGVRPPPAYPRALIFRVHK